MRRRRIGRIDCCCRSSEVGLAALCFAGCVVARRSKDLAMSSAEALGRPARDAPGSMGFSSGHRCTGSVGSSR